MRSAISVDVLSVLAEREARIRSLPSADRTTDVDLVARAQAGDRWAEEAIYRRHVRAVAGLVLRLLRNRAESEDVVQDTFAIALVELGALRDGAALRSWLSQIAVRQVKRRLRKRRLLRLFGLDGPAQEGVGLDSLAAEGVSGEVRAELAQLDRALLTLPVEQRIAWMLRYVDGDELEAVARACSCSLATVKRRIAAADACVRLHVTLKEVPS
jgi:RNA polymerase sigma-70 factor (ECF subfamily)